MTTPEQDAEPLAERMRSALEGADLGAIAELLHPHVYWGPPGDDRSGCHNRDEVLDWWSRGWEAGIRATVTEVVPGDDRLLVGLRVSGRGEQASKSGGVERWQVLTVREGLVVDIRGYEDRAPAAALVGVT